MYYVFLFGECCFVVLVECVLIIASEKHSYCCCWLVLPRNIFGQSRGKICAAFERRATSRVPQQQRNSEQCTTSNENARTDLDDIYSYIIRVSEGGGEG